VRLWVKRLIYSRSLCIPSSGKSLAFQRCNDWRGAVWRWIGGATADGSNTVLHFEEVLQVKRKNLSEFLPTQEFKPAPQIEEENSAHHAVLALDKVQTTSITKYAKARLTRVGRKNAASQLISQMLSVLKRSSEAVRDEILSSTSGMY
jgi:hypothetical protein